MEAGKQVVIRETTVREDFLIAKHFYEMWLDVGVPEDLIHSDWEDNTLTFIEQARQNLFYQGFVALVDGVIVGSASCQLFAGLYPNALKPEYRKYGYIWGVYVEKPYRRQGIARKLTRKTIEYLQEIGCTRAVLNASPEGKPVYEGLGFINSNAMHLDLTQM
ncbi:GNAT family N-acetyltransferase [Mastigocoleus testarum]|uniref:Acetyltransferase n=1 Tax=Mastigocoleus testarum BC008 TaxID=371196 RepID=A0A0V7ZS52_9CYAN|nr:GNAT family N-acetyltransferase [Mastigocoleus testarum]KST67233.1 acetyltransferase [Mastigocoleus testarum BC008]